MGTPVAFEIQRQTRPGNKGQPVVQETLGWTMPRAPPSRRPARKTHPITATSEPDLPPLVIEKDWIERVRRSLPELPSARFQRFQKQYELNGYDANLLISEQDVAVYFEQAAAASPACLQDTRQLEYWATCTA